MNVTNPTVRQTALYTDGVPKRKRRRNKKDAPVVLRGDEIYTKTFRFLDLPGELRNRVYGYLLVDFEYSIRFEADTSKHDHESAVVKRLYRARPGPPDRDDLGAPVKGSVSIGAASFKRVETFPQQRFVVKVFLVCKQINAEAGSVFYGRNVFSFGRVPHCYTFLLHFAHRLPLLRTIAIGNGLDTEGYFCGPPIYCHVLLQRLMSMLVYAYELTKLISSKSLLQHLSTRPRQAAGVFFV